MKTPDAQDLRGLGISGDWNAIVAAAMSEPYFMAAAKALALRDAQNGDPWRPMPIDAAGKSEVISRATGNLKFALLSLALVSASATELDAALAPLGLTLRRCAPGMGGWVEQLRRLTP